MMSLFFATKIVLHYKKILRVLFSFVLSYSLIVAAAPVNVNFSATYNAPSCDISAPDYINFADGQAIPSGNIPGNGITKDFAINFSNCKANAAPSAKPKVTVLGNVIIVAGTPLFADPVNTPAGNTTKGGYGVMLKVKPGNNFFDDSISLPKSQIETDNVIQSNPSVTIGQLDGPLPMTAILSCGNCTSAPIGGGGKFQSTLTFRLSYD